MEHQPQRTARAGARIPPFFFCIPPSVQTAAVPLSVFVLHYLSLVLHGTSHFFTVLLPLQPPPDAMVFGLARPGLTPHIP